MRIYTAYVIHMCPHGTPEFGKWSHLYGDRRRSPGWLHPDLCSEARGNRHLGAQVDYLRAGDVPYPMRWLRMNGR